jgi:uncharacterized protein (TIGR02117 family)
MGLWLRAAMLALLGPPLAYLATALLLGLMPANAGWVEAEEGVTIFVNTNGVHTGIGMPVRNAVMDWSVLVPAAHLREPKPADYVFIGYGHRGFYLDTPGWAEISPATALNAAFGGGETLIHVDHVDAPGEGPEQRALTLSHEEYARLVAFIRARFRLNDGRTIPLIGRGYGLRDIFYEAQGGYSLWMTCNEWTGRALRSAGVRMGFWTPLEQGVMWRLP